MNAIPRNVRVAQAQSLCRLDKGNATYRGGGFPLAEKLGPPAKTCQWLHGEPAERNFCGEPVKCGSSYCAEHHAMVWQKPDPKKHTLVRSAGF